MMPTEQSEIARKRYLYRSLVMRGKHYLPPEKAARLIGPDCAYHLYSSYTTPTDKPETDTINTSPENEK